MPDYDDNNKFVLFKNDKRGNDNAPDYTGKITIDGQDKRLAAWIRTPNAGGDKFMSGEMSEFQEKSPASPEPKGDFDDDVPF